MKPIAELPYILRLVVLVFFFSGLFALIHTMLSPFSPDGFFLDPRIINMLIALGLLARNRFWYISGLLSVSANVVLHILRLIEFAAIETWTVFYFLAAISIDIIQISILLKKDVRILYVHATSHTNIQP